MYERYYDFIIIRNETTILAIPKPSYGVFSYELEALYNQGFIYCDVISAASPSNAVEIFEIKEKIEINALRKEVSSLRREVDELSRENDSLRRNSHFRAGTSSVNHYEVFGFSERPHPDDLKKRYRKLCQILHPDKGGDKQLFQFIQQAFAQVDGKNSI